MKKLATAVSLTCAGVVGAALLGTPAASAQVGPIGSEVPSYTVQQAQIDLANVTQGAMGGSVASTGGSVTFPNVTAAPNELTFGGVGNLVSGQSILVAMSQGYRIAVTNNDHGCVYLTNGVTTLNVLNGAIVGTFGGHDWTALNGIREGATLEDLHRAYPNSVFENVDNPAGPAVRVYSPAHTGQSMTFIFDNGRVYYMLADGPVPNACGN